MDFYTLSYQCTGGAEDGSSNKNDEGYPAKLPDFNIWHRIAEPKMHVVKEKWKKYGTYEVKGRSGN